MADYDPTEAAKWIAEAAQLSTGDWRWWCANGVPALAEQLGAAGREVERLIAEVDKLRADDAAAAGECLVPVSEMTPGSHLRRVVLANRMWRYERDALKENASKDEARLFALTSERNDLLRQLEGERRNRAGLTPRIDSTKPEKQCTGMHDDGIADGNLTKCSLQSGCARKGCPYR
jgi:hypothetical protein